MTEPNDRPPPRRVRQMVLSSSDAGWELPKTEAGGRTGDHAAYPFDDPISGERCGLVFATRPASFWDGTAGVNHPGCDQLGDVSPDLDAFYCTRCGWNGRITGAWAVDLLRAHNERPS